MVLAAGRHRDSFLGGNEVIQVSQRSVKKDKQGTSSPGSGGAIKANNITTAGSITTATTRTTFTRGRSEDKKRGSIAGRMWESFESESSSEDDDDDDDDRGKGGSDKPNDVGAIKRASRKHSVSMDDDGKKSSRTRTDSNSRNNPELRFKKGNTVSVYFSPGRKVKGTVSSEKSRGRYDVTLENGDVEKRVGAEDLSPLHPRRSKRYNSRRSSDRSIQSQKSVRTGRRESRDRSASDDNSGSDDHDRDRGRDRDHERDGDTRGRRRSPPAPLTGPPSVQQATGTRDTCSRPVSPSLSKASSYVGSAVDNGGGDPGEQPSNVAYSASQEDGAHDAPTSVASQSEADNDVDDPSISGARTERALSSEQAGSLPLAGKVRQAGGLLKTMFWKKGEDRSGDEGDTRRRSSRGWSFVSRSASPRKRFSTDSGHDGDLDSPSAPPLQDSTGNNDERSTIPTATGTLGIDTDEGHKTERQRAGDADTGVASAPLENATPTRGYARRLSRGLTRGRSTNRNRLGGQSGTSESPASRSPSLVAQFGQSLRGAIMGKTLLGVHRPHVGRSQAEAGPGGDESSNEEGSTGGGQTGHVERRRRDSKRGLGGKGARSSIYGEDGGTSSDGFDASLFSPDSPYAPTVCGDPRNLPDAVQSYIDERARMEREMSASGPTFLPRTANLVAGPGDGMLSWGKRRGSLDITKEASSTTQHSEQQQPFTEAMFKAGVSETRHSTKQGILLEGELQKFSPESMRGVRWHKRYFVLYACACELRYYRTHAEAAWGRIPLGERGSIPLRLVVKIVQPSDKKYRGCRFDLVVLHKGDGRHPGLHIRAGHESRVTTTKTFKLFAADPQQRLLWVTVIEALMKKHGWGMEGDRRRNTRAPGHGASISGAGHAPWDTWSGRAGEEPVSRNEPQHNGSHDNGSNNLRRGQPQRAAGAADVNVAAGDPDFRQDSVLTFVEEDDQHTNRQGDDVIETSAGGGVRTEVSVYPSAHKVGGVV